MTPSVAAAVDPLIQTGNIVIDEAGYSAKLNGAQLDLTYTEFELLKYLAQHPGRVFSRQQLLSDVWGYDYYGGTRTVDVHVRRLRAKLGPEYESVIGTVRNVGYRFVAPAEEAAAINAVADPRGRARRRLETARRRVAESGRQSSARARRSLDRVGACGRAGSRAGRWAAGTARRRAPGPPARTAGVRPAAPPAFAVQPAAGAAPPCRPTGRRARPRTRPGARTQESRDLARAGPAAAHRARGQRPAPDHELDHADRQHQPPRRPGRTIAQPAPGSSSRSREGGQRAERGEHRQRPRTRRRRRVTAGAGAIRAAMAGCAVAAVRARSARPVAA